MALERCRSPFDFGRVTLPNLDELNQAPVTGEPARGKKIWRFFFRAVRTEVFSAEKKEVGENWGLAHFSRGARGKNEGTRVFRAERGDILRA